jgi:hypothetical protein
MYGLNYVVYETLKYIARVLDVENHSLSRPSHIEMTVKRVNYTMEKMM